MTIDLGPELEAELAAVAKRTGRTPEEVVVRILGRQIMPSIATLQARDEWERRLLAIGTPCGVSLTDEDLSRETMYD